MAYTRKTKDIYKIMWNGEEVDSFDTLEEAREMKKEYDMAFHSVTSIRKGRERVGV